MSDEDEEKELFKVEDRRHFDSEGNAITSTPEDAQEQVTGPEQAQRTQEKKQDSGQQKVDFTSILFSFIHTALVQLGDLEDPVRKTLHEDLEGAHQMIDILECLQQKTKGNLDANEERYLSGALFDLRMRYMEKAKLIR